MRRARRTHPRGLSLLELMLALSVTALIAGAIAGMLGAVASGVDTRRDNRAVMVRANAAAGRLNAYVGPSRCILGSSNSGLVLWLDDSRQSDTVHATEIRWLNYDATDGEIDVHYVVFPEGWTQTAKDLADLEYSSGADWAAALTYYETNDWTASMPLTDGLTGFSVALDEATALASRHVTFYLTFDAEQGGMDVPVSGTIRLHEIPTS